MAKKPKKLEDLFNETLKDIYFAENKILKSLPKMAKAAQTDELRVFADDLDDPGADLHEWYGRYYYFTPAELIPIESEPNKGGGRPR